MPGRVELSPFERRGGVVRLKKVTLSFELYDGAQAEVEVTPVWTARPSCKERRVTPFEAQLAQGMGEKARYKIFHEEVAARTAKGGV